MALLIGSGRAASGQSYAVVVHPSNPATNLRLADLRGFFSGAVKQWPNGSRVVLVARDYGSAAYQFLMRRVLNMSPAEYRRHLASIEFAGEAPVTLKVLNSEAAACKFVYNVPGSIALIEANSLQAPECHGVETLRIESKLPSEEGYRLR